MAINSPYNNLGLFGEYSVFSQEKINKRTLENYSNKKPWPDADIWHDKTYQCIYNFVIKKLKKYDNEHAVILNAGSGGTEYPHKGKMIHLDIIASYIEKFKYHCVASIEKTNLADESVDIIICVGSVINYADYQKSIKEFSRILKPGGALILEFERSNSAEFLFKKTHHNIIFPQKYDYNGQEHILWMYNEKHIINTLKFYGFKTKNKYRFHIISTLMNRFGLSQNKAAKFIKIDKLFAPISYCLAHNCILITEKTL